METAAKEILKIDKANWTPVKFGDVVFEPKENAKDIYNEGIEHVVGLEHIDSENIHLTRSGKLEETTTFSKKFKKGDVLFGRRRAYLKKAALASFDGICSGDITVFRAKKNILPELLPFVVNNEKFFDYAIKHSAGGLSPRVKFKDLANYEFFLPPKAEQASLAELLWAMDEVIERERGVLERLNIHNRSKKKELLTPEEMKNWKFEPLKNVFIKITTKNKSQSCKNVLTISANYGLINQEEYFKRSVASKDLSNYYLLQRGDFAYNKSYSDGYPAGAIKVLNRYNEGVVSPLYICFRSKLKSDFNMYYEQLFDFGFLNGKILSIAKEGARNHGLLNVAGGDFFELKIPIPPVSYLNKVIPILKTLDSRKIDVESKISSSQALLKSLINHAF